MNIGGVSPLKNPGDAANDGRPEMCSSVLRNQGGDTLRREAEQLGKKPPPCWDFFSPGSKRRTEAVVKEVMNMAKTPRPETSEERAARLNAARDRSSLKASNGGWHPQR